jgi:hypothetical protein
MFTDVQNHWAKTSIITATERNIFKGYPDGKFRPDAPVTRAEFSVIVNKAFPNQTSSRPGITFTDVPVNHWAFGAIAQAYQTKYLSGYPNRTFKPNQPIPRVQALTALVSGLGYQVTGDAIATLKKNYSDFGQIPSYAMNAIAAATQKRIVVNYPDIRRFQPNINATRGEIAAFICRILEIPTVPAKYIPGVELFVIPPRFDHADPFIAEIARVQQDNKWGYIDKTGKFIIPPTLKEANSFSQGLALFRN